MSQITTLRARLVSVALGAALLAASQLYGAETMTKSGPFKGPKANTGFFTHAKESVKLVLTLSDDFKTPDTPDPHWQVVDSKGTVYMLRRSPSQGSLYRMSLKIPAFGPTRRLAICHKPSKGAH